MLTVTEADIQELIDFERDQVTYQEPDPRSVKGFVVLKGKCPVVVSAPHGARCYRERDPGHCHEEDEYTAAIAHWLHRHLDVPAIYTRERSDLDPNDEPKCPYKEALAGLIAETQPRFVLDIHGANQKHDFAIDLGCRVKYKDDIPSCAPQFVDKIKQIWGGKGISVNHFAAHGPGTVSTFVSEKLGIPVMQVEINALYRIPKRKPDATIKDPLSADPEKIKRLLRTLAAFIQYVASP
jgi:hypothetical protein